MKSLLNPVSGFFVCSKWVFLLSLGGCKTSQEVARNRQVYQDPTQVKTVGDIDSEAPVVTQLRRDLDVTRGEIENLQFQHQKEIEGLQLQIQNLNSEKEKLVAELTKVSSSSTSVSSSSPQSVSSSHEPISSSESTGAESLWALAMSDLNALNYESSLKLFEDFGRLYSKNSRAPYSVLAVGLIKYKLGHFREAALSFNQVIDMAPKQNFSALAWLGQGASFGQLKQNEDAKLFLNEVKIRFPKSAEAILADQILKKTRKIPEDLMTRFPAWAGKYKGS